MKDNVKHSDRKDVWTVIRYGIKSSVLERSFHTEENGAWDNYRYMLRLHYTGAAAIYRPSGVCAEAQWDNGIDEPPDDLPKAEEG